MKPLVSISCITYNHAKYIRDAIEGFLIQKTAFKFEVLIHDDASRDGTDKIVKDYELKYSDLIFPIYQKENQYSKGVRGISATFNIPRARGKYIALCEGDDYWIDPYKLQKQVEFLESHADYGLVHTDYKRYHQDTSEYSDSPIRINNISVPDGFIFEALLERNYIGTLTILARTELLLSAIKEILPQMNIWRMGDYPLWLEISRHCKIKYLKDQTAIYRISPNTLSRPTGTLGKFNFFKSIFDIRFYFIDKYGCPDNQRKRILNRYYRLLIIGSVVLNSKELVEKTALARFKPNGLREWLFLSATKSSIIRWIVRILVKIAQMIKYNSFLDYSVS
jgi:glycosyltransferase involved in cell wall biosynthesis